MANSSLNLSSIDFDSLKQNFKEFLKTQSVFKDYDFDGSNINVLLDVMSYNSYLNAFYLNMVASEMFLDSAQKYDSVVSHAKELNYIPRSARSSAAKINLTVTVDNSVGKLTIPKGTRFLGFNSNGSFIFTTNENAVLVSSNTTFSTTDMFIYEGDYFTDSFVVDNDIESQQFILTNQNIDTNSITVEVIENGSNTFYNRVDTLFGLNEFSNIFFLQAAQNGQYEIIFGDGLLGKKPINGSIITVMYRICSGDVSDSVEEFTLNQDLNLINQVSIIDNTVEVVEKSSGGADVETIESIKFSAPRYFATQQRAISSDDYASLVITQFGGEISDVVVYGGQELEPKLYGRVVVCLKPKNGNIAPNYIKEKINSYLLPYISIPNRIIITDPEYLYCSINSKIQYDSILGKKSISQITSEIYNIIFEYSSNNLEKFARDLRYSKIISQIDSVDPNIVSNDTEIRIINRISPLLNSDVSYDIQTDNRIYVEPNTTNLGTNYESRYLYASLISSKFTYVHLGTSYPLSYFEDDNSGNIHVYTILNDQIVKLATIGEINYETGRIIFSKIRFSDYQNYISLYLKPFNKDIFANKNKIVLIDPSDVSLNITEVLR
jgi:hypothetical protein